MFTRQLLLLTLLVYGCDALAMIALANEKFEVLYKDDYDVKFFCCIPLFTINNKLVLIDKKQNKTVAQARYKTSYFNSTAELRLKQNYAWYNDQNLKKTFLAIIIHDIKERYPHINRLEYPHKNIAWDFV